MSSNAIPVRQPKPLQLNWTVKAAIVIMPLLGIFTYQVRKLSVATPPTDFGTGSMFDQIATRYDTINRVLAMNMDIGWREEMVQVVQRKTTTARRLLDVATGTADVALLLGKAMPDATIVGVDPSSNMLDVGRDKVSHRGMADRISLRVADARKLVATYREQQGEDAELFDGATMSFGIRNVPEREDALCQIHALLRPNAVFCVLEFSEPDPETSGILGYFARFFIRHVVPVVGGVLSGKPREYLHLQNSIKDFPNPKDFAELLQTLECDAEGNNVGGGKSNEDDNSRTGTGFFAVEEVRQLNFGSVQLYISESRHR